MLNHLGRLVNVSVKVPKRRGRLMGKTKVNWSEYPREAIETKIKAEAAGVSDEIHERAGRLPREELVKWIREDRAKSLG
jgi:hypothetical protein